MTRVAPWALLLAACGQAARGEVEPAPERPLPASMDPETCRECHPKRVEEWSGSMHAYASDDPLFLAMNARAQREGQMRSICVKCHAPMAAQLGLTKDGLDLATVPKALRGVGCYFCHDVADTLGEANNPLFIPFDGVMRGPIADPIATRAHPSLPSALHDGRRRESASLCGPCHDVVNRQGARIERTFVEWKASARGQAGATCDSCHMESGGLEPLATGRLAPDAPPRPRHSHAFAGVDRALVDFPHADEQRRASDELLSEALVTAVCVRGTGDADASLLVFARNVGSGHSFPSGASQHRRLWFEVTAKSGDADLYRSGAVPAGGAPEALADPDLWLVRDCLFGPDERTTTEFLDAVSVASNQLEAAGATGADPTLVVRRFPADQGNLLPAYPERVLLTPRLQPFPLELFDELFADPPSLGLTEAERESIRGALAAPIAIGRELVWTRAAAEDPSAGGQVFLDELSVPVRCVTRGGLDATDPSVPARSHARCPAPR